MQLSLGTVKKILEILCDEGGFLVEEKLNKLLQPLENDERSLIKLDAIFKVRLAGQSFNHRSSRFANFVAIIADNRIIIN